MDDKTSFYLTLIGRHLDNRKTIIFAAITLVLGFAVTLVQFHLKHELIVKPYPKGLRNAVVFTLLFFILWPAYFFIIWRIDANIASIFQNITFISLDDFNKFYFDANRYSPFIPFAVSLIMYVLIMRHLWASDAGAAKLLSVSFQNDALMVMLTDGRKISAPLDWYPRLNGASDSQRANYQITAVEIHWPDLDEKLNVDDMMKGKPKAQ